MLSSQQKQLARSVADKTVDFFELVHVLAEDIADSTKSRQVGKSGKAAGSAELIEEGEASSTDVIVAPISHQVMVEESRRRTRAQRSSATPPGGPARNCSSRAATKNSVRESFAAFTNKYRDVLGDADTEEAEAVYSMVALTQAKAPDWSRSKQAAVIAAELPDGRPAKRQQVAAAPACSEGGSSDSSAKSAPSPAPGQPGVAAPAANAYPGMMQGFTGMNHMQQQPAGDAAAAAAAKNMLGSCSIPVAPGFFPGMGLMGMPAAPGIAGCPLPPFMPPWAVPPLMFPGMFGNMGMFAAVPPGSPPLMSMPGHGMLPGVLAMPPAFMSGAGGSCVGGSAAAGEPATGFPVSGPVPAAGIGAAVPGRTAGAVAGTVPPAGAPCRTVAGKTGQQKQPIGQQHKQQVSQLQPQPMPVKQVPVKAEVTVGSPNSSVTAAAAGVGNGADTEVAAGAIAVSTGGIHQELEQLDLAALKHWVLAHFCEDVYLLLLDVWRPDSPSVRDAVWAWKLHIKSHKPGCSQPDYRAFLVSLFGLEKLLQLTAAATSSRATRIVPCPVPLLPRAVARTNEAGSGDSGGDNVTLAVAGSRMLTGLAPAASGTIVGSATSPHVLGLTAQPQPA